ncbi:MAG TPA: hypothetical protein VFJ07_13010 [Streptosporangiaceae bacterium]|nr:hypothetical protein [Streptosporangiaceae bacterium]
MLHDISHDRPGDSGADAAVTRGQLARQQAIRQIERRRRFCFPITEEQIKHEMERQASQR